jgi:hypothetical protein
VDTSSCDSRDAVILLLGLSQDANPATVHLARLLAKAFDYNAATKTARFDVVSEIEPAGDGSTFRHTVTRHDAKRVRAVLDVYSLDYRGTLLRRVTRINTIGRAAALGVVIVQAVPRLLLGLLRPRSSKSAHHVVQVLFALGILGLLVAYMTILLVAVGHVVLQAAGTATGSIDGWSVSLPETVTVAGAAAAALFPGLTATLIARATDYLSAILYLRLPGGSRGEIHGQLNELLEAVTERPEVRNVHIWTYSFGSLIALDALYPRAAAPSRRYGQVSHLITIGCPFDLIRLLWPQYFVDRRVSDPQPTWLNVYSSADVLGSNFRNNDQPGEADRGIELATGSPPAVPAPNLPYEPGMSRTLASVLTLNGLRAHNNYWGDEKVAQNCFGLILRHIYADDPALR